MGLGAAGGGAGGGRALDTEEGAGAGHAAHQRESVGESAHVGWFFLDPDDLGGRGVLIEGGLEFLFGPWVKLFDEDDRNVGELAFCALDAEVVADFAGADEQATGLGDGGVGKDVLEVVESEVRDGGHGVGVAEHGFWSEDDEGLAPFAQDLAAQEMEVLRGGGGLGDLDVVLCGELEVTLHAGAGVLGALAFVAVGEEHDKAGEQAPFDFAGGEELVDDDLGAVGEVAELGLPEDEGLGVVAGEAVLESEAGSLGEERVIDRPAGLGGRDGGERGEAEFGFDVDEDGVALVEGAALGVLAGETDGRAGFQERGVGEEFGHAVVEGLFAGAHFDALGEELFDFGVDVEAGGGGGEGCGERGDFREVEAGAGGVVRAQRAAVVGLPVVADVEHGGLAVGAGGGLLLFEEFGLDEGGFFGGVDVEALGVELVEGRVILDFGVAERLGDGGVVDFGVAVATVADEVDDDVGVEGLAVLGCEGSDADDGCGVFGVDVEDGDGEAFGEVGGKTRGVGFAGQGGEAEEVVDDDLDGAADVVAVEGGEVEALGGDALAGEGGVAVDDHGEDLIACCEEVGGGAVFGETFLVGAGAAHDYGVDGFEVAGVRGEVEMDGLAGGGDEIAGGADVVFDVATAEGAAGIDVFELGEDVAGGAADGVDHDVEAAAVAHGEDGAADAEVGGGGEELVEEGDEDGEAFEGEALGAEVALLNDLLEEVGADEGGEDAGGGDGGGGVRFEALLDPGALFGRGDVHELGANGGAVDAACGEGVGGVVVGKVGYGEGLGREELAEGVEGSLEITPAAEEIEGGVARRGRHAGVRWHEGEFGRVNWSRNVMHITDGV